MNTTIKNTVYFLASFALFWLVSVRGFASVPQNPKLADMHALSCQITTALKQAYPSPKALNERIREVNAELAKVTAQFPMIAWTTYEDSSTDYIAQGLYHAVFGYDGFLLYSAMIRDRAVNPDSFLGKMAKLISFPKEGRGKALKAHALNGGDANQFIDAALDEIPAEIKGALDKMTDEQKSGFFGAIYFGLGPTADKLALWLLSQSDGSVTYRQVLTRALEMTDGDIFSAIGILGSLFAADSSGRGGPMGAILNDKISMPKVFADIRDRAGANYHFWCYLALSLTKSPAAYRLLSFGFETVLQRDFREGQVDQLAITVGNQSLWRYSRPDLNICPTEMVK